MKFNFAAKFHVVFTIKKFAKYTFRTRTHDYPRPQSLLRYLQGTKTAVLYLPNCS